MDQELATIFLDSSARRLEQYGTRIAACVSKLTEEQVWLRGSDEENAIGNLLLHLAGNVRQWIISSIGGKPDVRVRDREFSARGDIPKQDLVERLTQIVEDANAVLRAVPVERLKERITVQHYTVTVLEAVQHVVEHFAMHTGQIVFATKALTHEDMGFYRHLANAAHAEKTP